MDDPKRARSWKRWIQTRVKPNGSRARSLLYPSLLDSGPYNSLWVTHSHGLWGLLILGSLESRRLASGSKSLSVLLESIYSFLFPHVQKNKEQ